MSYRVTCLDQEFGPVIHNMKLTIFINVTWRIAFIWKEWPAQIQTERILKKVYARWLDGDLSKSEGQKVDPMQHTERGT